MKICSKCKKDKDLSEFNKNKAGKFGVGHYCNDCRKEYANSRYDYDKAKERSILHRYNLTKIELQAMYDGQQGCCRICEAYSPLMSKMGGLFVDHNHITGKVRGLLCKNCNAILGHCKDDITILENSIKYLKDSI